MAFNPKSLENLAPKITSVEQAREMQRNSVKARIANKEARELLKLTAAELKTEIDEVVNDVSAIGVLRLGMIKAVQQQDFDEATRLATILAEFETPKLSRVDAINTDVSTEDLTDEELDKKLRDLGLKD